MAWQKGASGNPSGRKPGKSDNTKLRESITSAVPDIITMLVEQAKGGDVGAARLLLERCIAPIKAMEQPQIVPIPSSGSLTDKGHAVLQSVSAGEIAPAQGAALIGAIGQLARVAEIDQLTKRIEALEAQKNGINP